MPVAEKNKKNVKAMDTYAEVARYARKSEAFSNTYAHPVLALKPALTCLTMHAMTYGRIALQMRATTLLTFGSLMFPIMCALPLIKVSRLTAQADRD